jgi:hypothetical protein
MNETCSGCKDKEFKLCRWLPDKKRLKNYPGNNFAQQAENVGFIAN